jgi:hypothetical protein
MSGVSLALVVVLVTACGDAGGDDLPEARASAPTAAEPADLAALRRTAEPLRDLAGAGAAGYTPLTPCWYHRSNGGQGVHHAKSEWIDGRVSLLEPEIVMYEPLADGRLEATAVEYVVPFAQWTSQQAPTVLGQALHRNEALGLWVLHVWLWKNNPSGLYADWNPNVTCAHASESEDRSTVSH